MAYIVTKAPSDLNMPTSEMHSFVAENLADDGADASSVEFVKAYVDGDWHIFIFSIDGDELSECDELLSELEPIAIDLGVSDDYATRM